MDEGLQLRFLDERLEFAITIELVEVAVAANVLLVDKNVGNGLLARQLGQGLLNLRTILSGIEFVRIKLDIEITKQIFGTRAVRAVALAKDLYNPNLSVLVRIAPLSSLP